MRKFISCRSKNMKFNIIRGTREIKEYINKLPSENEIYKFISTGGFSTICFITFIVGLTKINTLNVSTLRVGKKELKMLNYLHKEGKLDKANFVVGSLMSNDSAKNKTYNYFNDLERVCGDNKWTVTATRNHSKILLFDTDAGKYVIETSSNLNENPKIEQFSFEKNNGLYDFYIQIFDELIKKH